ncbi:hypothetical protein HU200_007007 [Digitaria exilis]|uniref:Uncharacterized protein n=1 Tax=Digitaria exilis TaxID=1010633 RepID=A0A835KV14_9POAL|nr:hypothetical protein HU200_007007 [Digitaria exilis]
MGDEVAVVLEPPRPKSPPRYPDLCGRRRLQLELQILNREIDFLKGNEGLFDAVLRFQGTDLRCWFRWLKTSYNHLKEFHQFLEAVKSRFSGPS